MSSDDEDFASEESDLSPEERYHLIIMQTNKDLQEALHIIDSIADTNLPDIVFDPVRYYYEERDNEFKDYRVLRVYFTEDNFWNNIFDRATFNKCWHLASDDYFMKVLDNYHNSFFQIIRTTSPIHTRLYVLKSVIEHLSSMNKDPRIFHHMLYDGTEYMDDVLSKDIEFKRHVLCHYLYIFYKKYYNNS